MKYDNFVVEHTTEIDTTTITEKQFWKAVQLWNKRPNLVNKRLIGTDILFTFMLNNNELIDPVINELQNLKSLNYSNDDFDVTSIADYLTTTFNNNIQINNDNSNGICCYLKKLLPKCTNNTSIQQRSDIEIVILDFNNCEATFFNRSFNNNCQCSDNTNNRSTCYCYRITFKRHKETKKSSFVLSQQKHKESFNVKNYNFNSDWLKNKLLTKIVKWSSEELSDDEDNNIDEDNGHKISKVSLKLVNVNEYSVLYNKLKDVYGKKFVKIWPENTDPLKFVYEDVAIATYLLLLWRDKKQNFIDMGCGNGLLVHILTCEGHIGTGFDVRARKIWDFYPEGTADLQIKTITPTFDDTCLYPEVDWLIGNHSDELTPWLPVISSLSSYKCNFFLLPCCSYELNGQKYQRKDSSRSQYMDYLNYIGELCGFCGFNYDFDKLRIPSTKRICIVSNGRKYDITDHKKTVNNIRDLMKSKCTTNVTDDQIIYDNFTTRSSEIKVRNCTQLDKNFVNKLITLISQNILNSSNDSNCNVMTIKKLKCDKIWNEGTPIQLANLAKIIPNELRKRLKNECGGLQTLIKNHSYIFKIINGAVSFRKPVKKLVNSVKSNKSSHSVVSKNSFKSRNCWFYNNHPDRCPLEDDDCPFIHSSNNK